MGLTVGDRFTTPTRRVEPSDVSALVSIGGFIHPLFTDPAFAARSPFGRTPLPGQAVLLLMGGLVEQSGRVDDVVALVGFDEVRFVAPVFDGDEIDVRADVLSRGRRLMDMRWVCVNGEGRTVVEAIARLLLQGDER